MTATLKCPHCGSQTFTDYGDGLVACQRCYAQFDLNQQQCPNCGSLLAEGNLICLQCGADLRGDLAEKIIRERLMTPEDRRRARLSTVQQTRVVEEEASRQRLDAWWEEDRKRRETELQEQMARQRHERRFLILAAVVILAVALLVTLVSLVILSTTEPDPTPVGLLLLRGAVAIGPRLTL
jgi:RNA polymerase subunit RPABC4/transcription elongation factor Spt4